MKHLHLHLPAGQLGDSFGEQVHCLTHRLGFRIRVGRPHLERRYVALRSGRARGHDAGHECEKPNQSLRYLLGLLHVAPPLLK